MIVILGAGLTGLSAAYHLKDKSYYIFEKEKEVGGLCRSTKEDGFIFDFTGHLLHLRNDYVKDLVNKLLPKAFLEHRRRAWIYSKGVYTPYPFQVNLYGLPKNVVKECLLEFIKIKNKRKKKPRNFLEWILYSFGKGIAKHFMIPYNKKLWRTKLSKITPDWTSWSIPKVELEDIIDGALGIIKENLGYNFCFLYPKKDGIEILPKSFLPYIENLYLQKEVVKINLKKKKVIFRDKDEVKYDVLISTIPLPELISKIEDIPEKYKIIANKLNYLSVLDINLGIKRANISPNKHWIYFPESEFIFYRVGFYSNLSSYLVPNGQSSIYVEVSYKRKLPYSKDRILEKVFEGLINAQILKNRKEISLIDVKNIKYAYVIYDDFRRKNLPILMRYLENHDVFSIGRYGGWKYLCMEEAILEGKRITEKLL